MPRLTREMQKLARRAAGSYKTVHDRLKMAKRIGRHLLSLNIQVRSVQHLKARHIESYIVTLLIIEDRVALLNKSNFC